MTDNESTNNGSVVSEVDMGYEDAAPKRRGSMTIAQEKQRRASIKAILADDSLDPFAKRLSIQHLMDGRRGSMANSTTGSSIAPGYSDDDTNTIVSYGYEQEFSISNNETKRTEELRPPCHHYERNCTIIAPCCGAAFGCRICHDECPVLPPSTYIFSGLVLPVRMSEDRDSHAPQFFFLSRDVQKFPTLGATNVRRPCPPVLHPSLKPAKGTGLIQRIILIDLPFERLFVANVTRGNPARRK